MKYKIADVIIEMQPEGRLVSQSQKYLIDTDDAVDFNVLMGTPEEYKKRRIDCNFEEFGYLMSGADFYRKLLNYNGMMMHASVVVVEGNAYVFSAASGTGKSTHTNLWLQKFGDKAYIINDDKPAIREIDGTFYVYGTPWSGKTDTNVNAKAKLQGICFLERDEINRIERMTADAAVLRLMHSTLKKLTPELIDKEVSLINNLIKNIPIYIMGCTPTAEAADMAYDVMSKGL